MTDSTTLAELVARGDDGAQAIRSPGRDALTYDGLRALSQSTLGVLNAAGIGRNDRIAIVLPNGPEMATAFVSLAAWATASATSSVASSTTPAARHSAMLSSRRTSPQTRPVTPRCFATKPTAPPAPPPRRSIQPIREKSLSFTCPISAPRR